MSETESLLNSEDVVIPREEVKEEPKEVKEGVKTEVKEEPKEPPKEPPKDDTHIKYENTQKALRQERARAKELERRVEEMSNLRAELEEYRRAKQAEKQQQEEQLYHNNPAEYLRKRQEEIESRLNETMQEKQQREAAEFQQRQFIAAVKTSVHEFSKSAPDYQDAYNFVRDARFKEYAAIGMDESEFDEAFEREQIDFANTALQRGHNPAELIYNYAKVRGFGTAPQITETPKADEVIDKLEKNMKKNQTLKGAAATSSFLKRVDEMSDEEFEKYWNTEIKPTKIR